MDSDGELLASSTAACTPRAPMAGYIPGFDVAEVAEIDLDQQAMEAALKAADWATATLHCTSKAGTQKWFVHTHSAYRSRVHVRTTSQWYAPW